MEPVDLAALVEPFVTGEDSLYPMHLLRAGDDRADLVAAAVLRPRLRRMREGTLVHEHPDVPIGGDAAQILVEPGPLRFGNAAPMRRPASLHLEGVEHDDVQGVYANFDIPDAVLQSVEA